MTRITLALVLAALAAPGRSRSTPCPCPRSAGRNVQAVIAKAAATARR